KDRIPLGEHLFNLLIDLLLGRLFPWLGAWRPRLGAWRRRNNEGDHVMDDPAIAGTRFGNLHVFVFREAWINQEVMILVCPIGFEGELFRHLQDHVRLADAPPFDELRRRRQITRITLFGAAINPGCDGVYLSLRQTGVV